MLQKHRNHCIAKPFFAKSYGTHTQKCLKNYTERFDEPNLPGYRIRTPHMFEKCITVHFPNLWSF